MKKLLIIGGIASIAVMIILTVTILIVQWTGESSYQASLEELKSLGYPLHYEDMVNTKIPDHENGVVLYSAAQDIFLSTNFDNVSDIFYDAEKLLNEDTDLSNAMNLLTEGQIKTVDAYFSQEEHALILDLVKRAHQKEHFVFFKDFSDGPHMPLPQVSWFQDYFSRGFHYAMYNKDTKLAEAYLQAYYAFYTDLSNCAIIITQLVTWQRLGQFEKMLTSFLKEHQPSLSFIQSVKKDDTWLVKNCVQSLHGERVGFGLWFINNIDSFDYSTFHALSGSQRPNALYSAMQFQYIKTLIHHDIAYYNRRFIPFIHAIEKTPNSQSPAEKIVHELSATAPLSAMLFPALGSFPTKLENTMNTHRKIRLQLLLAQHKASTGSFPESLQELLNADIIRYGSTEAFDYKKTGDFYELSFPLNEN